MQINNTFEWHNKPFWDWPDDDKKLLLVNDWVLDLDSALPFVKNFEVALQAGGACGIWPAKLATLFTQVYTFEPCLENYLCLIENVSGYPNITHKRVGLGSTHHKAYIQRDQSEADNVGAYYLTPGDAVNVIPIDSLQLHALDFLCLDVEGAELSVLIGASDTIEKFKPVIMLENKLLPHMAINHHDVFVYLENQNYECAGRVHNDYIFIKK